MNRYRLVRQLLLSTCFLLVTLLVISDLYAKQFGLVVGINDYKNGGIPNLVNLEGAVNDADRIAVALRKIGVDLPKERLLINDSARLDAFKKAWHQMTSAARPGDTLIFTFAGHGGQENEFAPPVDEESGDGKDETLLFYDFDPENPHLGRINDDELNELFRKAAAYRILFVADSCHSGGLTRAVGHSTGRTRGGSAWNIPVNRPDLPSSLASQGDEGRLPPNVTMITGTDSDGLKVDETLINGKPHGALSWFFAEALGEKAADTDSNGIVTRTELGDYVTYRVATHMNQLQKPRLLPRSGGEGLELSLGAFIGATPEYTSSETFPLLAVNVLGGTLPSGIKRAQIDSAKAKITFTVTGDEVITINHTGDEVARFGIKQIDIWQQVIDKFRLLQAIDQKFDTRQSPVAIRPGQSDDRHPLGAEISFKLEPGPGSSDRAMVLFNLSGDGKIEFLYPLARYNDPAVVPHVPYTLRFETVNPAGGEDTVVLFCKNSPANLNQFLAQISGRGAPIPEDFFDALGTTRCQFGRYAFFTTP